MDVEPLAPLADEELMARFAATRAHRFLDELVRRHYPRVLAGSRAVLRDTGEAQDVAQEAFVRVLTRADQFNGGNFRAWLLRIARNLALDQLASRRGETLEDEIDNSPTDRLPRSAEVAQVLGQLTRPQRICLRLFYENGFSYREIRERTGYSEKAVKAHIQNGRDRFRRLWTKPAAKGAGA